MGLADMRILLFVSPSTATRTALLVGMESLRSNSVLLELSFHLDTDGPDEAQQLSSYCGHNLWLVLPSCEEVRYRRSDLFCAFPAISLTSSLRPTCRFNRYPPHQGRN